MHTAEHFDIEKGLRWQIQASPWISAALTLIGLSLPFLPDDGKPRSATSLFGLSAVLTLLFGTLTWYSWRTVRELHLAAVSLDEQGIWRTACSRDSALVLWSDVVRVRERAFLQRLDLVGRSGEVLVKLEYQLGDFPKLRGIVLERSALETVRTLLGQTFAKSISHHLFYVAFLAAFSVLAAVLLLAKPLVGGIVLLVVVGGGALEYLGTAYKVELNPTELVLSWPFRKLALRRAEIRSVKISDRIVKGARHPRVVLVHAKSQKPVALRGLGASAIDLYRSVRAWLRDAA